MFSLRGSCVVFVHKSTQRSALIKDATPKQMQVRNQRIAAIAVQIENGLEKGRAARPYVQPLDIGDEFVFLLHDALVVHAVVVALFPHLHVRLASFPATRVDQQLKTFSPAQNAEPLLKALGRPLRVIARARCHKSMNFGVFSTKSHSIFTIFSHNQEGVTTYLQFISHKKTISCFLVLN